MKVNSAVSFHDWQKDFVILIKKYSLLNTYYLFLLFKYITHHLWQILRTLVTRVKVVRRLYIPQFYFFFFEIGSHCEAEDGLKLVILLP
jgi:hypothetical protein